MDHPRRLAAVARSGLLDTQADAALDALTQLAATLLDVPAAFLSIVDAERDFYKSQHGFAEPLASARQLGGTTFCHYAIAGPGPLAIPDTHAEPHWKAVPTTKTLGVRAYLGVPLRLDGEAIGSFCAIDMQPRTWTDLQVQTMTQLAAAALGQVNLRLALEATQALARQHQQVLGVVAHDLRTPLQVLSLDTQMLNATAQPQPQQQRVFNRMRSSIDAMKRLLDDLLSADGGASVPHQRISAERLLADAADAMQPVAVRAGLKLRVKATPDALLVAVDYAAILRALCNLVGNAIKYCPPGSTVCLRAQAAGAAVCLSVVDDGPGIPADEQPRAFDRGFQGTLGRAGHDGLGLGLYIVRELVERHGGRVELDSQPGQGTTVTLRLPAAD